MDHSNKPNHIVKLVFQQTNDEEGGVTFLNIFVEKEGREITPEVMLGEPTLAEQWAHELLGFIEDFLRNQLQIGELKGLMLTMPKKKDMN